MQSDVTVAEQAGSETKSTLKGPVAVAARASQVQDAISRESTNCKQQLHLVARSSKINFKTLVAP